MSASDSVSHGRAPKGTGERVCVFIDLANVMKTAAGTCDLDLDLDSMVHELLNGRRLVAKYVFDGDAGDASIRLRDLERRGYEVRTGCRLENGKQKGVDVEMGLTMLKHAMDDDMDVAVVVSGDADFVPAVEMVRECGKAVEVASFKNGLSKGMRIGDRTWILDELPIMKIGG